MSRRSIIIGKHECIYSDVFTPLGVPPTHDVDQCLKNYSWMLEVEVTKYLKQANLEATKHPSVKKRMFGIAKDINLIDVPVQPSGTDTHQYLLATLSLQDPMPRTIKPSGLIFEDNSFLQLEQTVAWNPESHLLYLVKYSYHYGRMTEGEDGKAKEVYYFRYEKESDHEFHNGLLVDVSDYKPLYHFHGNSANPHFPQPAAPKNIREIIELLRVNLSRLQAEHNDCKISEFPSPAPFLK